MYSWEKPLSPRPKYHLHRPLELYCISLSVSQHPNSMPESEVYKCLIYYLEIMMVGELKTTSKFSITTGSACLLRCIILN